MPTTQQRNQILQRLDAALDAAEAGDSSLLAELIHQTFEYTFNGATYLVRVSWDSGPNDPIIISLMVRKL